VNVPGGGFEREMPAIVAWFEDHPLTELGAP